jgi:hypothetical protein
VKRICLGLVFSWLMILTTHAQAARCSIVALVAAEGETQVKLYQWQNDGYRLADTIVLSPYVFTSSLSSQALGLVVHEPLGFDSAKNTLYKVSQTGFEVMAELELPIEPRLDGWSYNNRYVAFHNIYDNHNNRLLIYDTETGAVSQPLDLYEIFNVTWSPSRDLVAFYAYDILYIGGSYPLEKANFAAHVAGPDGIDLLTIPLEQESFRRLSWLSGDELAVTTCLKTECRATIYNVSNNTSISIVIGEEILEAYLPALDSYLVSQVSDRNLFLMDAEGQRKPISSVKWVVSRPLLSADKRYVSFRAETENSYQLYVLDLLNIGAPQVIELFVEPPERIPPYFDDYSDFDAWNPDESVLLYEDQGVLYLFDAARGMTEIAVDHQTGDVWRYRWICGDM